MKLYKSFFDILLLQCPGVGQKFKLLSHKSCCPFVNECLERLTRYVSVWVRFMLNSSWNCFSYSDKACMVLCINSITCFIWCCFWPPSTEAAFSLFDSFCVISTAIFQGDNFDGWYQSNCRLVGTCDTTEWSFFIDSISFFRILISFCNASILLLSVCFPAGTSVGVFLLVLRLWRAFNIEFSTNLFVSFSARFCLLNLRQRFILLFLFNTAAYDGLKCSFALFSLWMISSSSSEGDWFLGLNFR